MFVSSARTTTFVATVVVLKFNDNEVIDPVANLS